MTHRPENSPSEQAIEGDARISDDDQNPLQELYAQRTGHLNETDMAFFRHWERLISLEEQELVRHRKEIWTMTAEERMLVGRYEAEIGLCLALVLTAMQVHRQPSNRPVLRTSARHD